MTQSNAQNQQRLRRWINGLWRSAAEVRTGLLLAWVLGMAVALSTLHHLLAFWEWDWGRQMMVLVLGGSVLALVLSTLLQPFLKQVRSVSTPRWIAFGIPAALMASVLAGLIFKVPETNHELIIEPRLESADRKVQIREIRAAYGNGLDLDRLSSQPGWELSGGLLMTSGAGASPLHVRFRGPVGEQIRVSFITSAQGGAAAVSVDGRMVEIDLLGADGNETRARLDTQYHWGVFSSLFLPVIGAIDALAILALLLVIWLAHESGSERAGARRMEPGGLRSHSASLVFVCSVGLVLHAWDFVNVPLRVTKDSPSYLQGAVHFVEHGNFDGAASYRGPGTTFLFAPAMSAFGRNPLGAKLTLHLLALGCAPAVYLIGWGLTRRRWVALASGLLTVVAPDLYAYADDVLSEVPHIFFLSLYAATLLHAIRSPSLRSLLACMLAGSMAVLVRADNAAAMTIGAAFLCVSVLTGEKGANPAARLEVLRARPLRHLLIAAAIAAIPLLAWSAHNLRVHGFFGISDYAGEVLYDGWIYYGENSGIMIMDRESDAVRAIDAAVPVLAREELHPTGWDVYAGLLQHGYDSRYAFSLLGQAALDSVRRHPDRALEILLLKLRDAPLPQATLPVSLAAPPDRNPYAELTAVYFNDEPWLLPGRENVEPWSRGMLQLVYGPFYAAWLTFGIMGLWLGSYRKPVLIWLGYGLLTANALLLPILIGAPSWRYLIPGVILLGPMVFAAIDAFVQLGIGYVSRRGEPSSPGQPQARRSGRATERH